MDNNNYRLICDTILNATMQDININSIRRINLPQSHNNSIYGPVYENAVNSNAPITMVYTSTGTGKSEIITDRAKAVINAGIDPKRVMILNMNIAKTNQLKHELPNIQTMTFSEFTHNIVHANYPNWQLSDLNSIKNIVSLNAYDDFTNAFIKELSIKNPQDKIARLTLFVNAHTDQVINTLHQINASDYTLESMICQNKIKTFPINPYSLDEIIINGVHNMPIPILCAILRYADKTKTNLFITGAPDEGIYKFVMAYGECMDVMSSYAVNGINIIRLTQSPGMKNEIRDLIKMKPNLVVPKSVINIANAYMNYDVTLKEMMTATIGYDRKYIKEKLDNHEQILILALSKNDINLIKEVVTAEYLPYYPSMKMIDMTNRGNASTSYGEIAVEECSCLITKYPNGITIRTLYGEIYAALTYRLKNTESPFQKNQYIKDIDNIMEFFAPENFPTNYDTLMPVKIAISYVIAMESRKMQEYVESKNRTASIDIKDADIILSTVHSAIDIQCDNVVAFLKNNSENVDDAVYKVALSRADKSEYLIFANYGPFQVPYQKYINTCIDKNT